jgi:hypothetical protein
MNNWEKEMSKDAGFCGREMDKRTSTHMFDTEKYIVRYEVDSNCYRKPTKWENVKNTASKTLKQVFVIPVNWLFGAIKCALCTPKKNCQIQIDLANYRISARLMQDRINELESENEVLLDYANNALREVLGFREEIAQKKKAAKKRPSSKKKR